MSISMKTSRSAFVLGFNAVFLQLIFLREWLCLFMGNELVLGIYLGAWMLFTGLGSLFSSFPPFQKISSRAASLGTWIFLLLSPLPALFLLRWVGIQGRIPGENPGLSLFLPALLILFFLCFLLGLQFAFLGRAAREEGAALSSSEAVRRIYLWESLGFALGGFLFTFLGLRCVQPIPILFYWTGLNALFVALKIREGHLRLIISAALVVLTVAGGGLAQNLQGRADRLQWRGFNLAATVESPYGRIAVTRNEGEVNFFQNGIYLSGSGEAPLNEETAHFVLLAHPAPRKVLVLGGGGGGLLAEILKHPIEEAVYLEADPFLLRTEEKFLPQPLKASFSSSRVRQIFGDARLFVRRTREAFDLIFCALPPPSNLLLNRFYTEEFYRDLRGRLAPGGILAVSVESAEGYISPELAARNGCILDTLSGVFHFIRVVPGWRALLLASPTFLPLDPETLIGRAEERKIALHFMSPGLIRHRLSPFQKEAFFRSLRGRGNKTVNTDARPLCFFFDLLFWLSRQGIFLDRFLIFVKQSGGFLLALFLVVLFLALVALGKRRKTDSMVIVATLCMGFSAMALEIFILTAFQAAYGYIYLQAGIMSAMFMLGSALGASSIYKSRRTTFSSMLGMASLVLFLFMASNALFAGLNIPELAIKILFALAMLQDGLFIGLFFAAASSLSLDDKIEGVVHYGKIYGWDLFGSSAGAVLVSTLLIPLLGLPAGGCVAGLLLLPVILSWAILRKPGPRK